MIDLRKATPAEVEVPPQIVKSQLVTMDITISRFYYRAGSGNGGGWVALLIRYYCTCQTFCE